MNLSGLFCKYAEELKCFVAESTSQLILVLCVTGNFLSSSSSFSFPVKNICFVELDYVTILLKWDVLLLKAPTSAL
jgi:hypothetical protein